MFNFFSKKDEDVSKDLNKAKYLVHKDEDLTKLELEALMLLQPKIKQHIEKVMNYGGNLEEDLKSLPEYMLQRIYDEQDLRQNAIPIPTHFLKK